MPAGLEPGATARSAEGGKRLRLPPVLGLTMTQQILVSFCATTVPVLVPELAAREGMPDGLAGLYGFVMYLGATAATLYSEPLLARLGAAVAASACVVLAALALLGFQIAWLPAAVAFGIAVGCGYGPVTPASSHVLANFVTRDSANLVFSIRQSGAPLGVLLAGLLVPAFVAQFGWRGAIVCVTAIALAMTLALLPLARQVDRQLGAGPPKREFWRPMQETLRHSELSRIAFACFAFSCVLGTIYVFIPVTMARLGGLDLAAAGACAAVAQAGSVVGRLIWGAIADRFLSARATLLLLGLLMAGSAVAMVQVTPAWPYPLMLLVCIGLGVTGAGWTGLTLAEVARLAPPGRAGGTTAASMVFNFVGAMVGPALVGGILSLTGSFDAAYGTIAAMALAGSLLFLSLLLRPGARQAG